MSNNFFQNNECDYFPCHKVPETIMAEFNCMFCYCPLHCLQDCGGNYKILPNGYKDCSCCTIPHFDYNYVIEKLKNGGPWMGTI